MRTSFLILISLLTNIFPLSAQNDNPASAYIQQLAIDPGNPNIIYAASTSAGLYKSSDKAESWQNITPDTSSKFYVVRIAPDNPNRIYTGGRNTGLWISNDKGKTWEPTQLAGVSVLEMAITPSNPTIIFILSRDGVYRTNNIHDGKWEKVFDYLDFQNNVMQNMTEQQIETYTKMAYKYLGIRNWGYSRFQKIAVSPHNPNFILLGGRWEGGYFQSNDGGDTWQHHWISGIFRRVDPIIFHPKDPQIIYVGTHHTGWYKTYNGGKS